MLHVRPNNRSVKYNEIWSLEPFWDTSIYPHSNASVHDNLTPYAWMMPFV